MKRTILSILLILSPLWGQAQNTLPSWALGGFVRPEKANPIITPNPDSRFDCPMREKAVGWEESDVFNPAATVKDGKIYVLNSEIGRGTTFRIEMKQ